MPDLPRADAVDTSSTSLLIKIRQAFSPTRERFTPLSDLAKAFFVSGEITNEADADDWRLVDPDVVIRNENLAGLLIFMDGPTWRHYLPIWLTIATTRGAQLRDLVSMVFTTLDPETVVLADDASRFIERTSPLTDVQRTTIADVLATFTSFPWIRANERTIGKVCGARAPGRGITNKSAASAKALEPAPTSAVHATGENGPGGGGGGVSKGHITSFADARMARHRRRYPRQKDALQSLIAALQKCRGKLVSMST